MFLPASRSCLFTDLSQLQINSIFGWEGSSVPLGINVLAGFEVLFPTDELRDTFDENVDKLSFGLTKTVSVGDVPGATSGGGVDTSGTAGLETHLGEGLFEVRAAGDVWNLDHGAGTETSTQVGWAGKDPTEMVVVHEVVTFLLKDFLDALGGCSEALEDFNDGI